MSWRRACIASLAAALVACAAPPAYQPPQVEVPADWKPAEGWRPARPDDAAVRGAWWQLFGDPQLDALEAQALQESPTLAAAAARLAQARSAVDVQNAGLFPQVSAGARGLRQQISANRPLTNYSSSNFQTVQNEFALTLGVSYEADLWARIRSAVEAARAGAEQSVADFQNARLVLTTDVANAYFNLRETDIELDVLDQSIALQRRAMDLATARHELGATSGLDVAQQQALLDQTMTQVEVLRRQRSQFETALAALTGRPAPAFTVAPEARPRTPPAVPVAIPSEVLQRRPDVASAERAMAAANAQIGVARAAYYPSLMLSTVGGIDSRLLSTVFDAPSLVWSLGLAVTQPLFDAGRTDANVAIAQAGYQLAVANYRRTVLTALQEVQDGLNGSVALDRAVAQARQAERSAERVLQLANDRYEGGAASYLEVITAQQALLNGQRQVAQLLGQRMLVSVFLVKAVGGEW
ncbi:efflux transporter outer membrane subunit [Ramlibacter ginsenosidimutans]|uniref:Efflux transporter outer membrane subunit n=1 Tax=Ramlibacter ginsenosidimutans TaxID=502333 RepID=A0A934TPL6_9BURK|nr:efflux transporter outer membrane subunit [Ramlibacter ginsenosidimutans]